MATTNEEILAKEFDILRLEIIAAYDAKGMRASGQFADSLEVRTTRNSATLSGQSYAEQLEEGRGPTTGGGGQGQTLTEIILQWIADKGIQPLEAKTSISSLAFLIARKIHREGWDRAEHGGVELISEVITPERVQKIIDKVSAFNVAKFSSEIKQLFTDTIPV